MSRFHPDFSLRAKHYRVDEAEKDQQAEAQDPNTVHWSDESAPFVVTKLKLSCLDEIKSRVGNPDEVFADNRCEEPESCRTLGAKRSLTPEEVGEAAYAYVFGNSARLRHHKAYLEDVLGTTELHVVAEKKVVIDKQIVISGHTPKVITADKLVFKPGGQIKNVGILTINASVMVNDT